MTTIPIYPPIYSLFGSRLGWGTWVSCPNCGWDTEVRRIGTIERGAGGDMLLSKWTMPENPTCDSCRQVIG